MKVIRTLTASLLLALASTTALGISADRVFAYAEANLPSIFTGSPTAGQYQQFNYRFYRASGNYLALDAAGVIFVLGPYTGGALISAGPATGYEAAITAWESAAQIATTGSGTAAQYFAKNAVGNTWTMRQTCTATGITCPSGVTNTVSTITATAGGVVTIQSITDSGLVFSSRNQLDATGALITTNNATASMNMGTGFYTDPIVILPAAFSVGTRWVQSPFTQASAEVSYPAVNAAITAINVTRSVPAGTFADCLQVDVTSTTASAAGTSTTMGTFYYSPTAGTVVESINATTYSYTGFSGTMTLIAKLQAGYVANR